MLYKLKKLITKEPKQEQQEEKIEIPFTGPPLPEMRDNPNFITEPRKIIDMMRSMLGTPLICSIPSTLDEDVYISKIIELQVNKNLFFIKPLLPDFGNKELQKHKQLQLSTHLNGIHMSINLKKVTAHTLHNSLYYTAPIPERIFYPQRRKHTRFNTLEHNVTFYGISERTGATVCGSVVNLSRRGCALITNNASARARVGETLSDCQLNIGHHTRIYFELTIRHINTYNDTLVILGGKFPKTGSMQEQIALDEFLADLETEEKNTQEAQQE